jgi:DNA segregation ATPase FtsK/SpoIIIE, S-DNA-T family
VAKNEFKKEIREEAPEEAPKAKKPAKAASGDRVSGIRAFLADERFRRIAGIFISLFALYLFVSCLSYLFSGGRDQHLILAQGEPGPTAETLYANWMGKVGAHLAHWFMFNYIGVGAFFLSLILFIWGFRVAFRKSILPLARTIRLSVAGMLYFPLLIGFLFHHVEELPQPHVVLDCNDRFVGAYGIFATEWCRFTLGWTGTLMGLLFVTAAFAIFNFNHQVDALFVRLRDWWASRRDLITPDEEEQNEEGLAAPEAPETVVSISPSLKNEFRDAMPENQTEEDEEEDIPMDELPEPVLIQEEADEEEPEELLPRPLAAPAVTPARGLGLGDLSDLGMEVEGPAEEQELSEAEIEERLQDIGEYDPKLDLSRYEFPTIELLRPHGGAGPQITKEELEDNKNKIVETLNQYKIEIARIKATIGPTVTLYEIVPAPGVRISKIKSLEDDIALSLAALGIRIIAPIPGRGTIGIEVPNSKPDVVSMRSLIASEKFQHADMELPVVLGKTISNEIFVADLAKMPHLLMAGATGQGKSVGLNAILVSLLYKKHPSQIKFVLVDPKKVELTLFNKIERHFLAKLPDEDKPIITDTSKVVKTLNSLCVEMDERYALLEVAQCRNIKEYNAKFVKRRLNPENGHRFLPYIVLVVDEFADLIMTAGREVETPIARLAQLARAIGIHLIIATQRPSVNIITGLIKANFPARIAFRVTSKIDSRTILDAGGADQLIGRGDMLFSTGNDLIRIQCGFVDTPEVEEITDYIGNQQGYPQAFLLPEVAEEGSFDGGGLSDEDRDELFAEAARIVVLSQQGSASLLQRKLKLGYNRAGRLIDQLEAAGVIGPFEGSKARKVLIPDEVSLEQFLKNGSST